MAGPTKAKKPVGRPTDYSEEIASSILERIATSSDGIIAICKEHGIVHSTFFLWLLKHKEFSNRYDHAKEMQMRVLMEESKHIADYEDKDLLDDGRLNSVKVQRDKLRLETRKWMIERLSPKKKEEDRSQTTLQSMLDEAMEKAVKSKERDY